MIRQAQIPKVPFDYNGSKSIPGIYDVKFVSARKYCICNCERCDDKRGRTNEYKHCKDPRSKCYH